MTSKQSKLKNWLWFIGLYMMGVMAVGSATYMLKLLIPTGH